MFIKNMSKIKSVFNQSHCELRLNFAFSDQEQLSTDHNSVVIVKLILGIYYAIVVVFLPDKKGSLSENARMW